MKRSNRLIGDWLFGDGRLRIGELRIAIGELRIAIGELRLVNCDWRVAIGEL